MGFRRHWQHVVTTTRLEQRSERLPSEQLDPAERLAFEHLLQWLRLSFLGAPVLVLLAFGTGALPYALLIGGAAAASYLWGWALLRYRPSAVLRLQLLQRLVDCGLVFLTITAYHAYIGDAYYDFTYLLFVVAAAATHGRRGAWIVGCFAAILVAAGRASLISAGLLAPAMRHFTDSIYYTAFFILVGTAVAWLMHVSARTVTRRDQAWRDELAGRNAELEESVRLRDTILTGVSHDLRSPLTTIYGQAQLGGRDAQRLGAASIEHRFALIEDAAEQMNRWIQELVDMASLRAGRTLELNRSPTDLSTLAGQVLARWQSTAPRHTLRCEAHEPVEGEWDPARLERVLDNLVGNAVKYSPDGGLVSICVETREREERAWAVLEVHDSGIGIPVADLAGRAIFEPFHRAENAAQRARGFGIGLWGVQRIVQLHGGSIEVESQEGTGSTFRVWLPLEEADVSTGAEVLSGA